MSLSFSIMTLAVVAVFLLGCLAITFEHQLHVNKTATALFTGVICWALYLLDVTSLLATDGIPRWFREQALADAVDDVGRAFALEQQLLHLTGETAGLLLFLIGAMTIVELIDGHEGFALVTKHIRATRKASLLWIVGCLTFFATRPVVSAGRRHSLRPVAPADPGGATPGMARNTW